MAEDAPCIVPFDASYRHAPTIVRRTPERVLRYNNGLPENYLEALWNNPATVFAAGKLLRSTGMRAASLVRLNGHPFIIKHYFSCSWRDSVEQMIQGPEALRAYELGCLLADAGVRTPRPVACITNHRESKLVDSYLLYPFVEGRMLRSSINQELLSPEEIERARRQLSEMWRQLASLHVGLKDANAGNFIVTPNRVVWLIDLDGSRVFKNRVSAFVRLKLSWMQVNRSMRRAMRERGRPCAEVRRAAA